MAKHKKHKEDYKFCSFPKLRGESWKALSEV